MAKGKIERRVETESSEEYKHLQATFERERTAFQKYIVHSINV